MKGWVENILDKIVEGYIFVYLPLFFIIPLVLLFSWRFYNDYKSEEMNTDDIVMNQIQVYHELFSENIHGFESGFGKCINETYNYKGFYINTNKVSGMNMIGEKTRISTPPNEEEFLRIMKFRNKLMNSVL